MRLRDLTIGTQLRFGLGIIVVLVIGLGGLAQYQAGEAWQRTRDLYEYPYMLRRAHGTFEADILFAERRLDDLAHTGRAEADTSLLRRIARRRADAARKVEDLQRSYLGPPSDIDGMRRGFGQWNSYHDETVRLYVAGQTAAAAARMRVGGHGDSLRLSLFARVDDIDRRNTAQSVALFANAMALHERLNRELAAVVAAIALLALAIAWGLMRMIRAPAEQLTAAAQQFRRGNTDVRVVYASANEFGTMAAAFNVMAEAIQAETRRDRAAAEVTRILLQHEATEPFCHALLSGLLTHTGSHAGAVYLLNDATAQFERQALLGADAVGPPSFAAAEREGVLGTLLAAREVQRITHVPAELSPPAAPANDAAAVREMLLIPIVSEQSVTAVILLASAEPYDVPSLQLVHDTWSVLTARLNAVLAYRQVRALADRLEQQNAVLDRQTRQLNEANRLKSTFLATMSHELRTPLSSMIALSGVLHRQLVHVIPAEPYGYLEVIERNGRKLLALINDILDLSRIEAGREEVRLGRFDVGHVVAEIVAVVEPQAREKAVELVNRVPAGLPSITSDAGKVRHILQNLVGNAVKFTGAGTVEITASVMDDALRVAVSDTGIGIAADQFAHIFDEFRQADDGNARRFGGSGLGLAIAKRYALLLGGDIAVESEQGRGATFTLRLPLTPPAPEPTTPILRDAQT